MLLRIDWAERRDLEPEGGHGVNFFGSEGRSQGSLIAVLVGFGWHHGDSEIVEIAIRFPDEDFDQAFLADARNCIERWVAMPAKERWHTRPSQTLWARVNG